MLVEDVVSGAQHYHVGKVVTQSKEPEREIRHTLTGLLSNKDVNASVIHKIIFHIKK